MYSSPGWTSVQLPWRDLCSAPLDGPLFSCPGGTSVQLPWRDLCSAPLEGPLFSSPGGTSVAIVTNMSCERLVSSCCFCDTINSVNIINRQVTKTLLPLWPPSCYSHVSSRPPCDPSPSLYAALHPATANLRYVRLTSLQLVSVVPMTNSILTPPPIPGADAGIQQGGGGHCGGRKPGAGEKNFFHLQITVCEFYFIFGELKWIFF